jgi:Rieske 2Fe-2S family protein
MTGWRTLLERRGEDLERSSLRELATPSYLLFPNVILILHPDYLSVLPVTPISASRSRIVHSMLVPRSRRTSDDEHWDKSFTLIDEGVFASEDLAIVEAAQRGLSSGANDSLLFGTLEFAALWFHVSVDEMVGP